MSSVQAVCLFCQLECFDYPHFHNSLTEWQVGQKWVSGFGKGAKCVFLDGSTGLGFYGLCMGVYFGRIECTYQLIHSEISQCCERGCLHCPASACKRVRLSVVCPWQVFFLSSMWDEWADVLLTMESYRGSESRCFKMSNCLLLLLLALCGLRCLSAHLVPVAPSNCISALWR